MSRWAGKLPFIVALVKALWAHPALMDTAEPQQTKVKASQPGQFDSFKKKRVFQDPLLLTRTGSGPRLSHSLSYLCLIAFQKVGHYFD